MSRKEQVDVEEGAPEVTEAGDWRDGFEHAIKAAREAFSAAAEATTEVLRHGGKLAEQTMSEAQRTVVVTLDEETFTALGKMVAAGLHKSRAEAVRHLLAVGIRASGDLLSRIDKVESQIEELRAKMREIPLEGTD